MARSLMHPRQAASFKDRFLRERVTAYTGTTYTTVATDALGPLADVSCYLVPINRQAAATGDDRAELASIRDLWFDPDRTIPEGARVVVAGHLAPDGSPARWNTRRGTFIVERAPDGTALYKQCDVTRA
jgi:hypothetical protein